MLINPFILFYRKGLKKACQKDMEFSFQYFLMICKTFLIKSSEAKKEMFFSNSEEEFFQEVNSLGINSDFVDFIDEQMSTNDLPVD